MSVANMNVVFNSGDKVYSKRMGRVGGFDGIIVEKRGNGYQVLDPKTGNIYQRDHYDLIALPSPSSSKASPAATASLRSPVMI